MHISHSIVCSLLLILLIRIEFNETAAISSSSEESDDRDLMSSILLDQWLNQIEGSNPYKPDYEETHPWKRIVRVSAPIRQRRRFGNTRYGRSLPGQ